MKKLALLTLAAVACVSCSEDRRNPTPEGGLPAPVISNAAAQIYFVREWAPLLVADWQERQGPPGANWTPLAPGLWRQVTTGYSSVMVGGSQSGEIRNAFAQRVDVRLTRAGQPATEFLAADHLALTLEERRYRYALPPAFPLDDPHDYLISGTFDADLVSGALDTLRGGGAQTGVDRLRVEGEWRAFTYVGDYTLRVDLAGLYDFCAAETLGAEIAVSTEDGRTELDRFSGGFSAPHGGDRYAGRLVSQRGPWIYGVDGSRGCPRPD